MPEKETPKKVCPECGVDMTGRDPKAHANDHWDPNIADKDLGKEATKRKKILLEM